MSFEIPKDVEEKISKMFAYLVPTSGSCETFEGEIIRAYNRIGYRNLNDGDYPTEGYGAETSGPALCFLLLDCGTLYPAIGRAAKTIAKGSGYFNEGMNELAKAIIEHVYPKFEAAEFKVEKTTHKSSFSDYTWEEVNAEYLSGSLIRATEENQFDLFRYREMAEELWGDEDCCDECGERLEDCNCCDDCGRDQWCCRCDEGEDE
jgi:hypothetical protein